MSLPRFLDKCFAKGTAAPRSPIPFVAAIDVSVGDVSAKLAISVRGGTARCGDRREVARRSCAARAVCWPCVECKKGVTIANFRRTARQFCLTDRRHLDAFLGHFRGGGYPRGRSGHPREPCRARDRFLEHFWSLPGLPLGALGLPWPPHRPHFSFPGLQKVDYGAPPWRGAVKRRPRGAER